MRKNRSWVLAYEGLGFGIIIALCWIREFTGLPRLLLGGEPRVSDWREPTVETLLIVLVWAIVALLTRRLVRHLLYLEGFLRVCAWCRKIGYQDKWIPLEEYFQRGFHVGTTHAVCPDCRQKVKEGIAEVGREELLNQAQSNGAVMPKGQPQSSPTT